ncbi:MAG: hypothetical protein R3B72_27960 [Polyangiaceae bacterium]
MRAEVVEELYASDERLLRIVKAALMDLVEAQEKRVLDLFEGPVDIGSHRLKGDRPRPRAVAPPRGWGDVALDDDRSNIAEPFGATRTSAQELADDGTEGVYRTTVVGGEDRFGELEEGRCRCG